MRIADLETPALIVDVDVMERNLQRLANYTRAHGLRLRPHTKTHKIPELARRQLELGAAGLTVAKVGEAEVMMAAQPDDILVEYPVIGRNKAERLAEVARQARVTVAVDSVAAAQELSGAGARAGVEFGVLAEADVGLKRVGVSPGEPLRALLGAIARMPHVCFEGVSFFPGHIRRLDEAGMREIESVKRLIGRMLDDVRSQGLEARVVSGGNTPTAMASHLIDGLNEIRSGTYIFNDRNTVFSGACGFEDCAAAVLATVVSNAVEGQMIIDGGSKTFSSDAYWGPQPSYGQVIGAPGAVFTRMNEEHGFVDIREAGRSFAVGDRVRVVPNHICPVVNLQDVVYGVRGDEVVEVYRVAARGKLQ